jgi:dTDP-4-dehydrorhamnose reductase
MKIIITGSGGQLGTDTAAELDLVINCAAYTAVDRAEEEEERAYAINRDGVRNLGVAAKEAGAALIHISTDFVFDGKGGGKGKEPYTEEAPTAPLGVYGSSKLAGEEALREVLPEHIIIRTSWLYGAHGKNFVHTMLRLATERESLSVVNDQIGSPTWTRDLARAISLIAKRIESVRSGDVQNSIWGIYGYSNAGETSWYGLAVAAIDMARGTALGANIVCTSISPISTSEYPTPAERPLYSVLDTTKIESLFNIKIPEWRESLKGMIKEVESIRIEAGQSKLRQTEVKNGA